MHKRGGGGGRGASEADENKVEWAASGRETELSMTEEPWERRGRYNGLRASESTGVTRVSELNGASGFVLGFFSLPSSNRI